MAFKGLRFPIIFSADRKSAKEAGDAIAKQIGDAGRNGGEDFFRETKKAFDKVDAELKLRLARREITQKQYDQLRNTAAKAYNDTLSTTMSQLKLTDAETQKLARSFKKVSTDGSSAAGMLQSGFAKVAGVLGVSFGAAAMLNLGKSLWNAANEAQIPWNRLAGTLDTVGIAMAGVRGQLEKNAKQFQEHTIHDDEAYAEILQDLIAISGDYAGSVANVSLVADLAAARHIDLSTAAQLVGKVMVGETGTLKRYGIVVNEGTDALESMRQKFKGMAENEMATIAGQQAKLNNIWQNAKEAAGGFLQTLGATAPMQAFGRALEGMSDILDRATEARQRFNMSVGQSINYAIASKLTGKEIGMSPKELLDAAGDVAVADDQAKQNAKKVAREKEERERAAGEEAQKKAAAAGKERAEKEKKYISDNAPSTLTHKDKIVNVNGRPTLMNTDMSAGSPSHPYADQIGMLAGLAERPDVEAAAEKFKNPWISALEEVKQQTIDSRDLFAELGDAWANGGLAGVAKWAGAKVKESLASAIQSGAEALTALARGNAVGAATHAKAAVAYGASAAAWRGVQAFAGASSGGGSGGPTFAGGGNVGGTAAGSAQPLVPELHVYLDQNSPDNPAFVRASYAANQIGQELFNGAPVHVTVHPLPKAG